MEPKAYLSRPYARRLTPDESGGYVATIQEFPGLVAEGETAEEALQNLELAAASWIEGAIETGNPIPEPVELGGYSGKIALRIPRGLHKRAAEMASLEGVSLNQWLTAAIAQHLGSYDGIRAAIDRMLQRVSVTAVAFNYSPTTIYVDRGSVIGNMDSSGAGQLPGTYLMGTNVGRGMISIPARTAGNYSG